MADLTSLQRRVDELIALAAILGPQAIVALEPAELLVAVAEGAFEASSRGHLANAAIRLSIALLLTAVDDACDSEQQAVLHLMLPASYPAAEAARVEALTCASLGREAEGRCAAALQALADEAARAPSGGQECLYPLAEAAMQQLQAALEAGQRHPQGTERGGTAQPAAEPGAGEATMVTPAAGCAGCTQLSLLRLDHMHARAAYSRTLRRWAGELGLGGRLLFSGGGGGGGGGRGPAAGGGAGAAPIILILLEGPAGDVKEFVVRLRTRNVDVDSKGRPCRERMMSVLAQVDLQGSGSSRNPSNGGGISSGSGLSAGGNMFGGQFVEQEATVPELAALLQHCGLAEHWTAATGLPSPPPQA